MDILGSVAVGKDVHIVQREYNSQDLDTVLIANPCIPVSRPREPGSRGSRESVCHARM